MQSVKFGDIYIFSPKANQQIQEANKLYNQGRQQEYANKIGLFTNPVGTVIHDHRNSKKSLPDGGLAILTGYDNALRHKQIMEEIGGIAAPTIEEFIEEQRQNGSTIHKIDKLV